MPKIYLLDVTNRDGVQTARLGLSKLEKTLINMYLDEMGVFQSEFGFPTTRHETNYLLANLELARIGVLKQIRLGGWIRATVDDVETTFERVPDIEHLNLSISTSDQMINGKFRGKKDRNSILKDMADAVRLARKYGAKSVGANAEDASRTDIDYLVEFGLAAKESGAERLRYCDTLGYDTPFTIYNAGRKLAEKLGMPIELHCHNDLGMAVANSIAGAMGVIDSGQDAYINTTINGIGERAGNADLVAIILAVLKSKDVSKKYELGGQVKLNMAWKICKFASYAFDVPIPISQPGKLRTIPLRRTGAGRARARRDRPGHQHGRVRGHIRLQSCHEQAAGARQIPQSRKSKRNPRVGKIRQRGISKSACRR
jgi:isopropylmalate/homocitrate/citramalate synthase